jgi:predicted nucleic acid-binding protein
MTENRFLIDSSAWVEFFDGTHLGSTVKRILENPTNECFVCGIVISEVTSKLERRGFDSLEHFQAMKTKATWVDESAEDCHHAGIKHAELKKSISRISYADALLMVLSEKRNMKIVSKDEHLKGKNTLLLR